MKLYHHRCRLYGKYYMKPSKVRDGVYMINPKPVQVGEKVRLSFGRISEVLEMPNMIEIQKQSHEWFLKEGLKATLWF